VKLVFEIVEVGLFAIFAASVIAIPFAWRLGSTRRASGWLRKQLPLRLQEELDRKTRSRNQDVTVEMCDAVLCLRVLSWVTFRVWLIMITLGGIFLILALTGVIT
jgi:hypothetical protein